MRIVKLEPIVLTLAVALSLLGCSGDPASTGKAEGDQAMAEPSQEIAPAAADEAPQPSDAATEQAARAEFEAQMAQVKSVIDSMDRPELIGTSPTKGPLDAKIVLIKFSDFQCPYCAIAAADMKSFTKGHTDDVLYVYKQFPLTRIHDQAMPAAKAAWAAAQQNQFWLYHDGLFAYQDQLGEAYYVFLAEQIGLDMQQFERDRHSPKAEAAINKDIALGEAFGIRSTPTFIMNELLIPGGAPLTFFEEAVRQFKASADAP